jgi:hypothetical protein
MLPYYDSDMRLRIRLPAKTSYRNPPIDPITQAVRTYFWLQLAYQLRKQFDEPDVYYGDAE